MADFVMIYINLLIYNVIDILNNYLQFKIVYNVFNIFR